MSEKTPYDGRIGIITHARISHDFFRVWVSGHEFFDARADELEVISECP